MRIGSSRGLVAREETRGPAVVISIWAAMEGYRSSGGVQTADRFCEVLAVGVRVYLGGV